MIPWTAAYQAPPSMGFSRQEYWSGVPFPSPEEISSLYNSIVFLYFFALITEESFLISPCCSLELCIQMGLSFLFSFASLASLLFTVICKASSDSHFAFLHFFSLEMVLIPVSCTNQRSRSFKKNKIFGVESRSIRNTRDDHGKVREEKATIF